MKTIKTILCLFILFGSAVSGIAGDPNNPQPDVAFFNKLRMDYAQSKDFNPAWKLERDRGAIIAAYTAKNYKEVVELSEHWLAKCPVDADVHMVRSAAANALGDLKGYISHSYFAYGLMQSVIQSGDGLAPKTAFKVISVAEEYSVLRDFGAEVTEQSLVEGPCDRMKCKFPGGSEVDVYFDVSIPFKAAPK